MSEILLPLLVGLIIAVVSQFVGHVLALRRQRPEDDCTDADNDT